MHGCPHVIIIHGFILNENVHYCETTNKIQAKQPLVSI